MQGPLVQPPAPRGGGIDCVSNRVCLGPRLCLCMQEEAAEEIKCCRILLCVTASAVLMSEKTVSNPCT